MRALAAASRWRRLCCAALPAAAQGWEPKRNAELQLLDKVTARVTVVKAAVGQAAPFGTLSIQVPPAMPGRWARCRTPAPGWRSPTACAPRRAGLPRLDVRQCARA